MRFAGLTVILLAFLSACSTESPASEPATSIVPTATPGAVTSPEPTSITDHPTVTRSPSTTPTAASPSGRPLWSQRSF